MERLYAPDIQHVTLNDYFWKDRQKVVINELIPYQWAAINDQIDGVRPSHTIENFRIAAGEKDSSFYGMVFQDSDLYKWLEMASYSLAIEPNPDLAAKVEVAIDLIGSAQEENGYLNTYYTVMKPDQKWTNLRDDHELYCAGHLTEAAVAYYESTGSKKLLEIAMKFTDHILTVFGHGENQIQGYPGHPEMELALMKLYEVTKERKYLELCKFFVDQRGMKPFYFEEEREKRKDDRRTNHYYHQSHLPIREQTTIEGHSVRAVYLYAGVAALADTIDEQTLLKAAETVWGNMVNKKLYVTGAIGSSHYLESFTADYDLPNDRAYAETCAAIGLIFWGSEMLKTEINSKYADVMERTLYNGLLSGMSLDGKSYFYVNPLEVWPAAAYQRHDLSDTELPRQGWFNCACCPPNIGRFIASFGKYIYSSNKEDEIYIHFYAGNKAKFKLKDNHITLEQKTEYPWEEEVNFKVSPSQENMPFTLAFRLPGWCEAPELIINGENVDITENVENGYVKINRKWSSEDEIKLILPMSVQLIRSNTNVPYNAGKVSVQHGPIVYALEEEDNGKNLHELTLSKNSKFEVEFDKDKLGGINIIRTDLVRRSLGAENNLYTTARPEQTNITAQFIPYYTWANRTPGEMTVWINEEN